jgi:uncharacterized protein YraI
MPTITRSMASLAVCTAVLIAVSAELANAAPARVATSTNLRAGPGTNFGVITTARAGSVVDVIRCGPEWCNVMFAGRPGYMVARNLGMGAPLRVVAAPPPPVVVVGPPAVYYGGPGPYYYGPRYYGPRRYWGWRRW